MLYPARWNRITVDHLQGGKVKKKKKKKNSFCGATRYNGFLWLYTAILDVGDIPSQWFGGFLGGSLDVKEDVGSETAK